MTDQRARAERLLTDLIQLVATDGGYFNDPEKAYAVAMAALADEQRAMVQKINTLKTYRKYYAAMPPTEWDRAYLTACDDILAALAKQGGGKK